MCMGPQQKTISNLMDWPTCTATREIIIKTILVVEDEHDARKYLTKMMSRSGFTILDAVNGEEALRLVESKKPDAVLLDLVLPDIVGDEVLQHILRINPATVVCLMTGYAGALSPDEVMKMGAKRLYVKPLTTEMIGDFIDNVVTRSC